MSKAPAADGAPPTSRRREGFAIMEVFLAACGLGWLTSTLVNGGILFAGFVICPVLARTLVPRAPLLTGLLANLVAFASLKLTFRVRVHIDGSAKSYPIDPWLVGIGLLVAACSSVVVFGLCELVIFLWRRRR